MKEALKAGVAFTVTPIAIIMLARAAFSLRGIEETEPVLSIMISIGLSLICFAITIVAFGAAVLDDGETLLDLFRGGAE